MISSNSSPQKKSLLVVLLSIVIYSAGIYSIQWWVQNSHTTYISENALMPGSATNGFQGFQFDNAKTYSSRFRSIQGNSTNNMKWIERELKTMGITHTELHSFNVSGKKMETVHSILRANKAAGTESIVLATKFYSKKDDGELTGIGLLLGMMHHLKDQRWLAKDIIFICTDGDFGDAGITEWLKAYHYNTQNEAFARGGNIQAAIIIEGPLKESFSQLAILPEGANGRLSNLDLLNSIYRIGRRDGMAPNSFSISPNPIILPHFIPISVHSLLNFMANQAQGIPTGDHGLFGMYHIDAVTLKTIQNSNGNHPVNIMALARVIEGTVRSLNNLIEHLHQSFYYYLLPSPDRYISIGEYMISLALILFPFFGRLLINVLTIKYNEESLNAAACIIMIYIYGAFVFTLPFVLEIFVIEKEKMFQLALIISAVGLIALMSILRILDSLLKVPKTSQYWTTFKSIASIPALLFIGTGSLLNFSFCLFCAVFIVPFYTAFGHSERAILRMIQTVVLLAISPIVLVFLASQYLGLNYLQFLMIIFEQLKMFSNFPYVFLTLIYLPLNLSFLVLVSKK
eukprot:TRINITY_DN1085_c0_g1_i3.p1 TRINITY_DN1085_c0_g1~~TRINITY_DN1085_c0_g1_i3.p1  ORF type:complete len:571 (+),score=113.00 TRINITY_DN1085_c0_g1_i3:55-1767(+)